MTMGRWVQGRAGSGRGRGATGTLPAVRRASRTALRRREVSFRYTPQEATPLTLVVSCRLAIEQERPTAKVAAQDEQVRLIRVVHPFVGR